MINSPNPEDLRSKITELEDLTGQINLLNSSYEKADINHQNFNREYADLMRSSSGDIDIVD